MKVRLTRKLAERLDGVDLSGHREGQELSLQRREAELLIAEGWACPIGRPSERRAHSPSDTPRAEAADSSRATATRGRTPSPIIRETSIAHVLSGRVENIHREVDVQLRRMAQIQEQVDKLLANIKSLRF